ncbi:hypothetical protein K450DRAFT_222783 [Umbelopsis ramanniana AG]|uniref:Uncharacterized protein n=1 Tax=Umbelopsis ramanniana AG TaxID=1314678 RepID=A0AAD5EGU0_UMBRA|nr:uncharacterized protein K450DRAFT_222783 [Umbelopsis ramanniana AG]KAI8583269.1 hypothetical protein K450DRAFT_222783 [Umbelopsis ramanniana AG]
MQRRLRCSIRMVWPSKRFEMLLSKEEIRWIYICHRFLHPSIIYIGLVFMWARCRGKELCTIMLSIINIFFLGCLNDGSISFVGFIGKSGYRLAF